MIAPQSEDWRDKTTLTTAMYTYKRWRHDRNTISLPHGANGDSSDPSTCSTHTNINCRRGSHRLPRMLPDSKQEEKAPTAHQHQHCTHEPPTTFYMKLFKGTTRWTPAHPEKKNSMPANWSRDDCLNHITDKVAIGK